MSTPNKFLVDDSIRNFLGFDEVTLYEKYKSSQNPLDILPFDNIFFETNIAEAKIFKGRRGGIYHNRTTAVSPGYNCVEKFTGGISWYMVNGN